MLYTTKYHSPLGKLLLASDGEALTGLWFVGQRHFPRDLGDGRDGGKLPVLCAAVQWLDRYFSGEDPGSAPPVQLRGTAFQLAVWQALRQVPYGQTVTYAQLAERAGLAAAEPARYARAVGAAVGRNPISIILPCHRVVGAGGRMTGYAGGMERKIWLLELEGARLSGQNGGKQP